MTAAPSRMVSSLQEVGVNASGLHSESVATESAPRALDGSVERRCNFLVICTYTPAARLT